MDSLQNDDNTEEFVPGNLIDTRTGHLDDLLLSKLENAFHKPTSQIILHDLAKIASEHDPIDLAHAASRLPQKARLIIYENLPDFQAKIIFIIHATNTTRAAIFRSIPVKEIVGLCEGMAADEAVWLLDDMSDRLLKKVFEQLNPKKAQRIRELFKHDRNSAGRLMTNEFFAFPMSAKIGEVAAQIRENPGVDLTRSIFVLSDTGELAGYVPERNLIVNSHHIPIRQVMQPILHKVTADMSRDEVVDLMERYQISALPVVDRSDNLVGVISFEDAVEAMKDILDETIASIGGTGEDVSEHEGTIRRFFWRAPWLFVTLLAGLVTSSGMAYFTHRTWFIYVVPFVQLIVGMSGNVGIQCSTLIVRSISSGELTVGSRREVIFKELGIGLLIGMFFGTFCGLVVYFLNIFGIALVGTDPRAAGMIVAFGVLFACLTATTLGTLSPFLFAKFRIDPAVASGPMVTAFNDLLSTWMFFFVASAITFFFFY